MAESVSLFLKLNGQDIEGENTETSLGRENSIECVSLVQQVKVPAAATGPATGRRQYDPIVILKRIDKSSPLIAKGLVQSMVAAGVLKFYRPNPAGDGTTEQFFTIEFQGGRVAGVKEYLLDTLNPAYTAMPPLEEVSFVFNKISWTYTDGGVTFEDTISGR